MLGGNESIPNLLVLGSTNHFNKIDDAILRRFSANFYVGVPSKEERKKILLRYMP
jgi:SpoVK/Ycf46/Vps4 family AAA+-type ATPase